MPRINTGLERSRSPSHSGSDSEVEEKPLSLTRQRRTAAQHTSSAWAALVPAKKGHDGEEEETFEEEKVENRRSLASQSSAARGNRFKKTASPASRKSEFETPKSVNVEVVCPRVESPKLSSANKASPVKPKAETGFMDQDQLESIEKEVEKHRNEADKVASANESALEAEESPTRNGDSSITQNVVPDFGNESAKPSGRGRGRGGGRGSRGGRGGGTPGRGRGASRLTMPALPNMPGGPRAMLPNRGGGMPAPRMGNFSQYGNQPPVGKWLMENGEGRAPMKVLRLRASGPSLSNANPATGTMPPKPITSIATSNSISAPSNFSKEVGELSAKLANRNISGSTAKELTDLVTQLQEELDRVKEDRQKLIANNREYVDQMQLSHATALDIKDSRIRQLESTLEKLQANYDSSLKRIEHLVLKHEVDGAQGGAKINAESAPKISAQPQRINVAQILESKNILANTSKPVPQKHPASTSSYSSMDEPPPKIARSVPHIRVQDQRMFSQQLRDSVLAAKERREMGDESMSDSEARDELEDEEFDEEDPMMDTIMETQRQLFESGLP